MRRPMAKRVSPTTIGIFVAGSFAVLVAALIVVGSGNLFRHPLRFICMFEGDLNGLKVGAPVKVRGVQIGTVEQIKLVLPPGEGRLRQNVSGVRLPVIVDLDRSQITARGGSGAALGGAGFEDMIRRGLRAQLRTESLLTGLLYIDFDLHPGAPLHLVLEPGSGPYPEIPTVPTSLEAVQEQATKAMAKFDQIDFKALVASLTAAADSINNLASSPELKATLESLKETSANLNRTVSAIRAVVDSTNRKVDPMLASIKESSAEANATMKQTRAVLVDLQSTLDPESPLAVNLNGTLEQLNYTARSLGELSDYLQRNPSAVIRGKYTADGER